MLLNILACPAPIIWIIPLFFSSLSLSLSCTQTRLYLPRGWLRLGDGTKSYQIVFLDGRTSSARLALPSSLDWTLHYRWNFLTSIWCAISGNFSSCWKSRNWWLRWKRWQTGECSSVYKRCQGVLVIGFLNHLHNCMGNMKQLTPLSDDS